MRQSLSYTVEGDTVMVGFGKPYALYHEFGTSKMVRRGLLTADPGSGTLGLADRQDILDILNRYLSNPSSNSF